VNFGKYGQKIHAHLMQEQATRLGNIYWPLAPGLPFAFIIFLGWGWFCSSIYELPAGSCTKIVRGVKKWVETNNFLLGLWILLSYL
jgi:hypothetical protein